MMVSKIAQKACWIASVILPLAAQTRVSIETEAGVIDAVLDDQKAPITAANFLKYVDAGQYNGAEFFRTVRTKPDNQPKVSIKIDVIQAQVNRAFRDKSFGPIPLERTRDTGLKHVDGALSMPRNAPDSATSGFSICIGEQPEIDFPGPSN